MTTATFQRAESLSNAARARQVLAIVRFELTRILFNRRAIRVWLVALFPVVVAFMWAISPLDAGARGTLSSATQGFGDLFHTLILRLVIFFGTFALFVRLFRGEVLDRSLHFWFLAPLRRETLTVAKFTAGIASAFMLFGTMVVLLQVFFYMPFSKEALRAYFITGPGLWHFIAWLGVTFAACLGYGAVALLAGLYFKNPNVPVILFFAWEGINPFLPPLLKKISVVHYLHSMSPIQPSLKAFQVMSEATPVWLAIPGLAVVVLVSLSAAAWKLRNFEITYGE